MEEQTAVEWLIEKMHKNIEWIPIPMQEQAKEMEKKQKMDSFNNGLSFAINPIPKPEDAKNYYKKSIKKTNDR
jgi:hypothetical protein